MTDRQMEKDTVVRIYYISHQIRSSIRIWKGACVGAFMRRSSKWEENSHPWIKMAMGNIPRIENQKSLLCKDRLVVTASYAHTHLPVLTEVDTVTIYFTW